MSLIRPFAGLRPAPGRAADVNFGVSMLSFPQVIFSFGTAPEYEP